MACIAVNMFSFIVSVLGKICNKFSYYCIKVHICMVFERKEELCNA